MTQTNYYFSLKYTGIQKTILRHDRLRSMAGISQILLEMNEIEMPAIAENHQGIPLVAGGGNFTARFKTKTDAEKALQETIKTVATTLPMLEFQYSLEIREAREFKALKKERIAGDEIKPGIIQELNEYKRCFRGYGVTFNPHLRLCEECGEYPAASRYTLGGASSKSEKRRLCRICEYAKRNSKILVSELKGMKDEALTTIKAIYQRFAKVRTEMPDEVPSDFKDLFPQTEDSDKKERQRIAVWFSDLNAMNEKVMLWLDQENEEDILKTFHKVRQLNIEVIADALVSTFTKKGPNPDYLPFRIIVAGGDDLCLVMPENYICKFACNLSHRLNDALGKLPDDHPDGHPLDIAWLKRKQAQQAALDTEEGLKRDPIKPLSFGGSFVVASSHSPFHKLHEIGEALMTATKKQNRAANGVNWRIIASEITPVSERLIEFDKPVPIEKGAGDNHNTIAFETYVKLARFYSKRLSGSHAQQIIQAIIDLKNNSTEVEVWLKQLAASELYKSFEYILVDKHFRENQNPRGAFISSRLTTMLELMRIAGEKNES